MNDFSNRGFTFREVDEIPIKSFEISIMWVDKVQWSGLAKDNIIRCYRDGFSFWRGHEEDLKEWFCKYENVIGFHQPLGLKLASPIVKIRAGDGTIDCMLGQATDYIKQYIGEMK